MPTPALTAADLADVETLLAEDDRRRTAAYPGDDISRQPVHTVYVPADRVGPDLTARWSEAAIAALDGNVGSAEEFAAAAGVDAAAAAEVWEPLRRKLRDEPIEDLRVDLEDGYGVHPDDEEDAAAVNAGTAVARAFSDGTLPPYIGTRFKSFEGPTRARGLRSLDLILGAVLAGGELPPGWVITLPKVTSVTQVRAMNEVCRRLESAYGLDEGRLRFEIQVETAQTVLGADGTASVAPMLHAADGRCSALHFGTYDYMAGLGIAGGYQAMDHPSADYAKTIMQLAAAGTGVRVSDGSTNRIPVGSTEQVHAAWALHTRLVRRSLERGLYQGWDLHPAQLPTRYLATYLFFRDGIGVLGARLGNYLGGGAEGDVMDEPATAKSMAGFLVRGLNCGAVSADEVTTLTGQTVNAVRELAARRF